MSVQVIDPTRGGLVLGPGTVISGTYANRPASTLANVGVVYFATDTVASYLSTGAAWVRTSEPAGALYAFPGASAPTGTVLAFGQNVSRTAEFTDLFAALGTTHGAGDGSTTFGLPDLRGRYPHALDNMGGSDAGRLAAANTLGSSGGSEKVTLVQNQLPASLSLTINGTDLRTPAGTGGAVGVRPDLGTNFGGINTPLTNSGGGQSHDNMPPYMLTNWLLKL